MRTESDDYVNSHGGDIAFGHNRVFQLLRNQDEAACAVAAKSAARNAAPPADASADAIRRQFIESRWSMVHARMTYGVAGCDIRRICENAVLPRFGDGTNIVQPGDAEI